MENIETNKVAILQNVSALKWNKLSPTTSLYNFSQTIRYPSSFSTLGTLGNAKYILGTDRDNYSMSISADVRLSVGIATDSHALDSLIDSSDLIHSIIDCKADTPIIIAITEGNMSITNGAQQINHNLISVVGSSMYPWVSSIGDGDSCAITISRRASLEIYIDKTGAIVFDTKSDGTYRPIKFITGTQGVSYTGAIGVSAPTTLDVVETTSPASNLTLKVNASVNEVVINTNGDIIAPGNVSAAQFVSSGDVVIKSAGGSAVVVNNLGNITTPGEVTANTITSLTTNTTQINCINTNPILLQTGVAEEKGLSINPDGVVVANNLLQVKKKLIMPIVADLIDVVLPAIGEIVFVSTSSTFYGYDGTSWKAMT